MASMDVTRNQLKHVSAATIHLKNKESKIGAKVRNLSYKLLRAKSKLEAVSAAKEKTKSIVSNLTQTLDKLKSKTKAAKKEKDLIINGEVAETKEEIKKALLEIKVSEERFQESLALHELPDSKELRAIRRVVHVHRWVDRMEEQRRGLRYFNVNVFTENRQEGLGFNVTKRG
ncbi:hypothetical protein JHK87_052174 [Glycine soja]|nr:hypothetical protein JHK87_052174 [Glycine soja]